MIGKIGYPAWMLDPKARAAYLARLRDQKRVTPVKPTPKLEKDSKK